MVAGDEILLFYFRSCNQLGFHTVGTDLCRGKVLGLAVKGVAVAVNIKRSLSGENVGPVLLHALHQPFQFRIVASVRNIEHILLRHEAEGVDRIGFLLRR